MAHNIKPGVATGDQVQEIFRYAKEKGFALPAVNVTGSSTSNGVMDIAGQKVELTKNEFRMLQLLFSHKGEIVTREALMTHLWDSDCFVEDNTLAVNMTRLRNKLSEYEKDVLIITKKGIGYLVEE